MLTSVLLHVWFRIHYVNLFHMWPQISSNFLLFSKCANISFLLAKLVQLFTGSINPVSPELVGLTDCTMKRQGLAPRRQIASSSHFSEFPDPLFIETVRQLNLVAYPHAPTRLTPQRVSISQPTAATLKERKRSKLKKNI